MKIYIECEMDPKHKVIAPRDKPQTTFEPNAEDVFVFEGPIHHKNDWVYPTQMLISLHTCGGAKIWMPMTYVQALDARA